MRRSTGAVLVLLGCAVLGIDVPQWDRVLFDLPDALPGRHGIWVSDVVGLSFVLAGIAALWTAPPNR